MNDKIKCIRIEQPLIPHIEIEQPLTTDIEKTFNRTRGWIHRKSEQTSNYFNKWIFCVQINMSMNKLVWGKN